jgi:hypothetical protein
LRVAATSTTAYRHHRRPVSAISPSAVASVGVGLGLVEQAQLIRREIFSLLAA